MYDTLYSTGKLKLLIVELLVNSIHPLFYYENAQFKYWNKTYRVDLEYSYTAILAVLTLVRIYHVVRLIAILSRFRSPRSQRLCQMNGAYGGNWYALKCILQEWPY